MSIEARYYDLTHGVHGFITLYVLIALFSLAGLKRGRATFDQFLYWPFTTLPTMVVLGISISVLLGALDLLRGKVRRDWRERIWGRHLHDRWLYRRPLLGGSWPAANLSSRARGRGVRWSGRAT